MPIYTQQCQQDSKNRNKLNDFGINLQQRYIDACPTCETHKMSENAPYHLTRSKRYLCSKTVNGNFGNICDKGDVKSFLGREMTEEEVFQSAEKLGQCIAHRQNFRRRCIDSTNPANKEGDDSHKHFEDYLKREKNNCNKLKRQHEAKRLRQEERSKEQRAAANRERQEKIAAMNEEDRLKHFLASHTKKWRRNLVSENGLAFMNDFSNPRKVAYPKNLEFFINLPDAQELAVYIIRNVYVDGDIRSEQVDMSVIRKLSVKTRKFLYSFFRLRKHLRRADPRGYEDYLITELQEMPDLIIWSKTWQAPTKKKDGESKGGRRKTYKRKRKSSKRKTKKRKKKRKTRRKRKTSRKRKTRRKRH